MIARLCQFKSHDFASSPCLVDAKFVPSAQLIQIDMVSNDLFLV